MVSRKEIESGVAEKRGMKMDDEGPTPAELVSKNSYPINKEPADIKITKRLFSVKSREGTRILAKKGTHFEVEDGIIYLYDGEEEIGVFGLNNFAVEISKVPEEVE